MVDEARNGLLMTTIGSCKNKGRKVIRLTTIRSTYTMRSSLLIMHHICLCNSEGKVILDNYCVTTQLNVGREYLYSVWEESLRHLSSQYEFCLINGTGPE